MSSSRINFAPTSILMLVLFKSSQICCVTTLILGLQPRLNHNKGFGLQNCHRIQAHFHKCEVKMVPMNHYDLILLHHPIIPIPFILP